ncbi:MAG: ABC transporter permease [Bacilli bacterium]|nr:ABC transporter permease [Bacilli bacterium]MDD4406969.1 ABC transporter permease [Bacilli bacterium]
MKDITKFIKNLKLYFKYAIRSAKAELKSEITDSYLNWLWWIIEPLSFMLIYAFVFGYVFKNTEQYFIPFVLIGITVWEFFSRMINGSVKLVLNNKDLITKVYIPKYVLLLSKSLTYLFKLFISFGILVIIMIFLNVPFTLKMLYFIPILFTLYVISFGIGLILMHYGVYIQDLSNLTNIVLRCVFYLSGVFYNISTRIEGIIQVFLLQVNPVAFLMNEFRKILIYNTTPSFEGLLFWLAIGSVLTYIGIHIIHENENSYAKVI